MPQPRLRPAAPALAVALAIAAWSVPAAQAQPAPPAQADATFAISLPAQALGPALNELARQARLQLMVHPDLVAGKRAPAVAGTLTARQALNRLLADSGLSASVDGSAVVIRATAPTSGDRTLPTVLVTAALETDATAALQQEGTAADGYRPSTVSSVGALGSMRLQDTPFSVSVVPRELLQNIQAQSPDDVYKLNPSTRTSVPQVTSWTPSVNIRGFDGYNTAEDGLRRIYNHAAVIEDKERIEVLNGLSGFLFGAATPGGMVNFVYKRPTIERLNSITLGNYGGSQYYAHGDFGGRFDEAGRVGYRLNVVKQDGKTAVDDQTIRRELVSAAIDWQVSDRLLLEFNAVYNKYATNGASAFWYFPGPRGKAPDASKLWSQPWIRDEFENSKLMAKATYRVNEHLTLRGAFMRDDIDRPLQDHTSNMGTSPDQFEQLRLRSGKTADTFGAANAFADIAFDTGPLSHKMTVGYYSYSDKSWGTSYNPNTGFDGPYGMVSPSYVPEPLFPPNTTAPYYSGRVVNKNFLIGDTLQFTDRWSVLLGLNRSQIVSENIDALGARVQPDYKKSRNSPSASLVYKPAPWLTGYTSYIEGLEQGGIAPDTAVNSGAILPPMLSKQKEIGLKATVGKMLLTTALFDIEKAYEFTDANNVYTQSGRQNHKGLEFSASGKPSSRLTVVGGMTVLNAKVKGSDFYDKSPQNVAKVLAKIYSEYELPVPGLTLTGGIYYTGRQWADADNTDRLPSFTTADLGLRYTTRAAGRPLTLRLNVSNLANRSYWLNSAYVGAPRSVAFSAQMQF